MSLTSAPQVVKAFTLLVSHCWDLISTYTFCLWLRNNPKIYSPAVWCISSEWVTHSVLPLCAGCFAFVPHHFLTVCDGVAVAMCCTIPSLTNRWTFTQSPVASVSQRPVFTFKQFSFRCQVRVSPVCPTHLARGGPTHPRRRVTHRVKPNRLHPTPPSLPSTTVPDLILWPHRAHEATL